MNKKIAHKHKIKYGAQLQSHLFNYVIEYKDAIVQFIVSIKKSILKIWYWFHLSLMGVYFFMKNENVYVRLCEYYIWWGYAPYLCI